MAFALSFAAIRSYEAQTRKYFGRSRTGLTRFELASSCVTGRRSNQAELQPQPSLIKNFVVVGATLAYIKIYGERLPLSKIDSSRKGWGSPRFHKKIQKSKDNL